jgi:hypothetical protein
VLCHTRVCLRTTHLRKRILTARLSWSALSAVKARYSASLQAWGGERRTGSYSSCPGLGEVRAVSTLALILGRSANNYSCEEFAHLRLSGLICSEGARMHFVELTAFCYPMEKFTMARRLLMLPHPLGEAAAIGRSLKKSKTTP